MVKITLMFFDRKPLFFAGVCSLRSKKSYNNSSFQKDSQIIEFQCISDYFQLNVSALAHRSFGTSVFWHVFEQTNGPATNRPAAPDEQYIEQQIIDKESSKY